MDRLPLFWSTCTYKFIDWFRVSAASGGWEDEAGHETGKRFQGRKKE